MTRSRSKPDFCAANMRRQTGIFLPIFVDMTLLHNVQQMYSEPQKFRSASSFTTTTTPTTTTTTTNNNNNNNVAIEHVETLGHRIPPFLSGGERETAFDVFQRISVTVQRFNSA